MQWWCSARGIPWSWTWQPYVGVWLLVIALGVAYYRWHRRTSGAEASSIRRWRIAATCAGIATVWVTLDWPVGPLGAGYLVSVHMVQFMALAFVAPPLLLFGLPAGWETSLPSRIAGSLAKGLRPLPAWIGFNAVVVITQLPPVVDTLMASQVGSFVFDLSWLAAGLAFWWPLVRRWPPPGLSAPLRLVYLLGGMMAHMASGLVFAQVPFPLYRIYEFAPPIPGVNPADDQFQGGGLMTLGDVLVGMVGVALLLAAWRREESAREAAQQPTPPH
jgi:putative membrane protein